MELTPTQPALSSIVEMPDNQRLGRFRRIALQTQLESLQIGGEGQTKNNNNKKN